MIIARVLCREIRSTPRSLLRTKARTYSYNRREFPITINSSGSSSDESVNQFVSQSNKPAPCGLHRAKSVPGSEQFSKLLQSTVFTIRGFCSKREDKNAGVLCRQLRRARAARLHKIRGRKIPTSTSPWISSCPW